MFPAVDSKTVEDVLFPGIDVRVERVNDFSGALVVEAVSTGRPARCPGCRKQARRVHGSYQRSLDDRPLGSRRVVVRRRVRRYFCDRKWCFRPDFRRAGAGPDRTAPPIEHRADGVAMVRNCRFWP